MKKSIRTLALIGAAISLTMGNIAAADRAFERSGSGTYSTSGDRTGKYSWRSRRDGNRVMNEQSITTSGGRTFGRAASTTFDRETGTVNRTVTSPFGRTRESTWSYNPESRSLDRVTTGAAGWTVHSSSKYDPTSRSIITTHTGPGGKTATVVTTPNNRFGRNTSITGPRGRSWTWSTSNARDPATGTVRHTVTGPQGRSWSVDLTPD